MDTKTSLPTNVEVLVQDISELIDGKDAGHVIHALGEIAGRVLHGLEHVSEDQRRKLCQGLAARAFKTSRETTSLLRCVKPEWMK